MKSAIVLSEIDSEIASQIIIDSEIASQIDSEIDSEIGSEIGSQIDSEIDSEMVLILNTVCIHLDMIIFPSFDTSYESIAHFRVRNLKFKFLFSIYSTY
jgi:hypothetical protein